MFSASPREKWNTIADPISAAHPTAASTVSPGLMRVKNPGARFPEFAPVSGEAAGERQRVEGQIGIYVARRHGDLPDHRVMIVLILEPKLGVDAVSVQTFDHRHDKIASADGEMDAVNRLRHGSIRMSGAGWFCC